MSTTTSSVSSSMIHSSDGSSVTSASYTTSSYSTVDPPSTLKFHNANQSTISAISDPSAASSSTHYHSTINGGTHSRSIFAPVVEETSSALEDASSGFRNASTATSAESAPSGTSIIAGGGHDASSTVATRTSVDVDGVNIEITSSLPPSPVSPILPLECDYDVNPTALYQMIESKKWDKLNDLFDKDPVGAKRQAATWVTRKETNGKLRWRLLPIHAAVIFQSPPSVVEILLEECPEAAQAKDDQGMLPLHLAFRTKITCWETIEELITSHPHAIFVKDRKGRTPLECGLAAATVAMASEAAKGPDQQLQQPIALVPTASLIGALAPTNKAATQSKQAAQSGGRPVITPTVQKSIFSVLELYTQISVQDHLQSAMNNSRKALETRIGAVQDSHVATLTQLKKDWENQRNELSRKIQGYRKEIQNLKSDFNIQQELLEEKVKTEMELVDKLQQVTTALEAKTAMDEEVAEVVVRDITNMHSQDLKEATKKADVLKTTNDVLKKTNKELLLLLETLLDQQNSLKLSLDKLSWDNNAKNQEQQDLLNRYLALNEQSVEMAESYTQEWQDRLEKTSQDVSSKLAQILNQNQRANVAGLADEYDGEEKKDPHVSIIQASSAGSSLTSSRDP